MRKEEKQLKLMSDLITKGVIETYYGFGRSGMKEIDKKVEGQLIFATGLFKAGLIQYIYVDPSGLITVCEHYDPNAGYSFANEFVDLSLWCEERNRVATFNKLVDRKTRGRLYKLAKEIKSFLEKADCWYEQGDFEQAEKIERMGQKYGIEDPMEVVFREFPANETGYEDFHCFMPSTFELMCALAEEKGIL